MRPPNTSLRAFAKLCLTCVYRAESLLAESIQGGQCLEHWLHRQVRRSAARESLLSEGCQFWAVSRVTALLQLLNLILCSSLKKKQEGR